MGFWQVPRLEGFFCKFPGVFPAQSRSVLVTLSQCRNDSVAEGGWGWGAHKGWGMGEGEERCVTMIKTAARETRLGAS